MLAWLVAFAALALGGVVAFRPLPRSGAFSWRLRDKTPLVAGGKRVEVEAGSSMMQACAKLGLKVPTKCKKGDCGTCTVTVGGKKVRACIGKVPDAPKLKSLIEKGLPVSVDNA